MNMPQFGKDMIWPPPPANCALIANAGIESPVPSVRAMKSLKPASIVTTRPGFKLYVVVTEITLGAGPPPRGNATVPVDTAAFKLSVSGPLYVSGMLARVLVTDDAGDACATIGMNSKLSPAKAKSGFRRAIFIFMDVSPCQ